MSMKPRFMPQNPGGNPWEPSGVRGVPIASALSFSSKSPFLYDDWERSAPRPFQIVAMPGYVPAPRTSALDADADYAWFDRPIEKPTIIWDGFCAVALWEVIYEAFRQAPQTSHLRVRNVADKSWVQDNRSVALLNTRPVRDFGGANPVDDPYEYACALRKYRKAIVSWANQNGRQDTGGYQAQADWRRTADMYMAVLAPKSERHVDGIRRRALAEAKWNRDHLVPIVEASGYRSPVRFMDVEITHSARRVFAQQAVPAQEAAARRQRDMPPEPVAQLAAPRPGLWSRIFGV